MRFVLVHGAFHGGWCWEAVSPLLRHAGHEVAAPDLPCEDPTAGAERYAEVAAAAAGRGGEPAVIVGHSLGGLIIPVAAALIPTRLMVFLCALPPLPGSSFDGQHAEMGTGFEASETPHPNDDGSTSWPEQGAIETYFHDCAPDVARAAARRLRRQFWKPVQEVTPLVRWPAAPSAYVIARDDRAVAPAYLRQIARERFGIEPVEIGGGHSPFLSRPEELAALLVTLAETS